MGQYYQTQNISKMQYLKRGKDTGAKLMETAFMFDNHGFGSLISLLLDKKSISELDNKFPELKEFADEEFPFGIWSGDKIVFAGDYADKDYERFPMEISYSGESINEIDGNFIYENLYGMTEKYFGWFKNHNVDLIEMRKKLHAGDISLKVCNATNLYFINHTNREYVSMKNYLNQPLIDEIDMPEFKKHKDAINPLPLLLATSNGGGGGYHSDINKKMVGHWVGGEISSSFFKPDDTYSELKIFFNEHEMFDLINNPMNKAVSELMIDFSIYERPLKPEFGFLKNNENDSYKSMTYWIQNFALYLDDKCIPEIRDKAIKNWDLIVKKCNEYLVKNRL